MGKLSINIGSKPLSKLIDAVGAAIGQLYEPTRIRRKAQAASDAEIILVKGRIKQVQLARRAAQRLACQELRRQENIEAIVDQAKHALPDVASDTPVDPDWVSAFFTACQDVSNDQLRQVWGRLLAMEVSTPGVCSRATVHMLQEMGPEDARIFEAFGSFVWFDAQSRAAFAVWPYAERFSPLQKYGFRYEDGLHLGSLGLVHFSPGIAEKVAEGQILRYAGEDWILTRSTKPPPKARPVRDGVGAIVLTRRGTELYGVITPKRNEAYFSDVAAELAFIHNLSPTKLGTREPMGQSFKVISEECARKRRQEEFADGQDGDLPFGQSGQSPVISG